jgi:hypothetical protein
MQAIFRTAQVAILLLGLTCGFGLVTAGSATAEDKGSAALSKDELSAFRVDEEAARVADLERRLTNALRALREGDLADAMPIPDYTGRDARLFPDAAGADLIDQEVRLNRTLELLYRAGAADAGNPESQALMFQAVTGHFLVALRRAVGPVLHTEVPALAADPDCRGDLMADGTLGAYFAALASGSGGADLSGPVAPLRDLARLGACLSERQSALLAAGYVRAFGEVADFLRQNNQDDLIETLAGAVSAPFFLTYDIEKRRGPMSPLARWFVERQNTLIGQVETGRLPSVWHGLWLYDWRSGRLVGFRHSGNPSGENEVDLVRFLRSVADPVSLGDHSCPFADMVMRGADWQGYFCGGRICAPPDVAATLRAPRPGLIAAFVEPLSPGSLPASCGRADNSVESAKDGGDPRCLPHHAGAAVSRADAAVTCVTASLVHPGTETFACLTESTGLCGNPVDRFTKDLTRSAMAGVKVPPGCAVSEGDGTGAKTPETKRDQALKDAQDKLDKQLAENAANLSDNPDLKAMADLDAEIAHAADVIAAENQYESDSISSAANLHDLNEAYKAIKASNAEAFLAGKLTERQWEGKDAKLDREFNKKYGKLQSKPTGSTKQTPSCSLELGDCGTSSCTAIGEAVKNTLDCVAHALDQMKPDPDRLCPPDVCTEFDPGVPAPAAMQCYGTLIDSPKHVLARQCWATTCGPGFATVARGSGCGCEPEGGSAGLAALGNACTFVRCSEGEPTLRASGQCSCEAAPTGTPRPVPTPTFNLPRPGLPGDPQIDLIFNGVPGLGGG